MSTVTTLKKGLLTNFFEGYDDAPAQWEQVATKIPSSARSETYGWLGSLPRMREMKGERIPAKLLEHEYTLVNKKFEASIEVEQDDIDDDQTGKYGPLARSIGESAKMYPDELIFGTLLPAGFTTNCYDGQYFFDTDHPIGDSANVQSNKGTAALDATSFNAGRVALSKMKDDSGRPINVNPKLLLVVPVDLQATSEALLEAAFLASGATNTNYQKASLLVCPWFTDATDWFLLNTNGVMKPFILQERSFVPFESLEEGSDEHFMRDKLYYGTKWRGNAGYGLYQKAYGAKVSG